MAFKIIRNDITKVKADAIVNTANPEPIIGGGTDSAIYKAAGEEKLLAERKKIGKIKVGTCAATKAYNLSAKYIIHTVGPYWIDGNHNEEEYLKNCYTNSLQLAKKLKCKSIAFPFISTGVYKFPKAKALSVATSAINEFLLENDMSVILVVYDNEAFKLSGKLYENIDSYIDENYVEDANRDEYELAIRNERARDARRRQERPQAQNRPNGKIETDVFDIEEYNIKPDKTFQEKLFEYIDASGLKDPEIYKAIGMSRQGFNKIVNNKYYQPHKNTAMQFCVLLKLDHEQSLDLMKRAGFTFSSSNKRDLAIEAFIRYKEYDVDKIENYLASQNFDLLYKWQ